MQITKPAQRAAVSFAALPLCDIKGPLPLPGLPPFLLTATLLVVCAIICITLRTRKKTPLKALSAGTPPAVSADTPERLASEYHQRLITLDELFCRMAPMVSAGLISTEKLMGQMGMGLTSCEVLELISSEGSCSAADFKLASRLLQLCDRAKFARYQPTSAEVEWALSSAAALLKAPSGDGP